MKKIIPLLLCAFSLTNALAQMPDTDIWLVTMTLGKGAPEIGEVKSITHRPGYDNQPRFMPDSKSILYTAIADEGQADVFQYFIADSSRKQLTKTKESEYSPTPLASGRQFNCVQVSVDSVQSIYTYPILGAGVPFTSRPPLTGVGYFCKPSDLLTVAFILGEPNQLQLIKPSGEKQLILMNPGRCILEVPGEKNILRFVDKTTNKIMEIDLATMKQTEITSCLEGSEDFAFLPGGDMLMGREGKLYIWHAMSPTWKQWLDLTPYGISDFYRIAVSAGGDQFAVVSYTGKKP